MKEKISYRVGSFVDYENVEHKFIIAAVSQMLECATGKADDFWYTLYRETNYDCESVVAIPKCVRLGISICNPEDTFNEQVGLFKAVSRARNTTTKVLFTTEIGLIGTDMVNGLLEQEVKHVQQNPGKYIPGYDEKAAKYASHHQAIDQYMNLNDDQKSHVDWLSTLDEKQLNEYLQLVKKLS